MTDIRYEIELVTPGLNFLEGHGEGAKSVVEQTKKTLHQAADRIEKLEGGLRKIIYEDLQTTRHADGSRGETIFDGYFGGIARAALEENKPESERNLLGLAPIYVEKKDD